MAPFRLTFGLAAGQIRSIATFNQTKVRFSRRVSLGRKPRPVRAGLAISCLEHSLPLYRETLRTPFNPSLYWLIKAMGR
jgi:hypothetical protein